MSQAVAAPAAPGNDGAAGGQGFNFRGLLQSVGLFIAVQAGVKYLMTGGQQSPPTTVSQPGSSENGSAPTQYLINSTAKIPAWSDRPLASDIVAPISPTPYQIAPIWQEDVSLDLRLYVSQSPDVPPLTSFPYESLVLEETKLVWNDWSDTREISTSFDIPREVQNNETLWGHFFVAQTGSQIDPSKEDYDTAKAFHFVRPLTQYLPKKKVKQSRNLLSNALNETDILGEEKEKNGTRSEITQYYHPNFTLSLIPDSGVIVYSKVNPAIYEFLQLERTDARDATGHNGWYYPTLFLNTFWQLRTHMIELNNTVTRVPINLHLNRQANWMFNIMASMDYGTKQNAAKVARGEQLPTGGDGSEMEQMKSILLDSNPYLLATTVFVSILHTIFEFLAFKSDIGHWRKKKDNVGVSVRTILANVVMQLIIFLYLLDNSENTSYMILVPQGLGIFLEAWKISKTVDVRLRPTTGATAFPLNLLPYTVVFEDKHKLSETEIKTQEYDQIAFKYLYLVAIPLLLAYAVYSLVYESHKSWYSFIITTLVGSVYAYGFLMMVPSLYINYRLKSVAHMPAKAMTFKFLNTFIDDLFAFTIKMPMLHRLATLRDDVIFFVYLYQSWKYKVDFTRVNEFGQGGDDDDDDEEDEKDEEGKDKKGVEQLDTKLASKPLTAPADGDTRGMRKAGVVENGSKAGVTSAASGRVADGVAKRRK